MDQRYFSVNENFIKNYNEERVVGYFHNVYVQYLEKLLHNDLPFLPEIIKIEEVEKLIN